MKRPGSAQGRMALLLPALLLASASAGWAAEMSVPAVRLPLRIVASDGWANHEAGVAAWPVLTVCRMPGRTDGAEADSPYVILPPSPRGAATRLLADLRQRPADLKPPAAGADAALLFVGPSTNRGENWCPVALSRENGRLVLEVEGWADDGPRRSNIPSRRAWLLALGPLPPGRQEIVLRCRKLFYTVNRDRSSGLEQYAWAASSAGALAFDVGAEGAPLPVLHERDLTGQPPPARDGLPEYWQLPRYRFLPLPMGNLNGLPKLPAFHFGSLTRDQAWNTSFADWGEAQQLAATLAPPDTRSGKFALIFGPRLNSGEALTVREVRWKGRQVTVHVELWRDDAPRDENIGRVPLLIAEVGSPGFPPAGEGYEARVEWTCLTAPKPGGEYRLDPGRSRTLNGADGQRAAFRVVEPPLKQ